MAELLRFFKSEKILCEKQKPYRFVPVGGPTENSRDLGIPWIWRSFVLLVLKLRWPQMAPCQPCQSFQGQSLFGESMDHGPSKQKTCAFFIHRTIPAFFASK